MPPLEFKGAISVLASGGMDSDILIVELAQKYKRVFPIYVRQGLAWEEVELHWLRKFLAAIRRSTRIQPLRVLELPMNDVYGDHWSVGRGNVPGYKSKDEAVYLPGRNLTLISKAVVFCALNHIPILALGSLGHNPFPDASPKFFKLLGRAISMGLAAPVRILAPFRSLSKIQVLQRNKKAPLHLSYSCLSPKGWNHCGRCNKCAERQRALRIARVQDFTEYAN